ncbi:MAG TPA: DUF3592 domain-containing protein [Candidatus Solibacter sp.]|jgi:hypothetical protein
MDRNQNWTPPDRLGKSSSRNVRLSDRGLVLACLAGVLFVGALAAGIFFARTVRREQQEQRLLDQQGITADAVITRVWRNNDKSREPRVTYRFTYRSAILSHSVGVPLDQWRQLKEGAPLAVRFVPSRPEISHPVDWPWRGLPAWFPFVFAAVLAGGGALIAAQVARQMRLLAEGRPTPGRMTGFRKSKQYVVRYEFELPDGTTLKGRADLCKMPESGKPLCVLYDPENPRRNALYPLPFVRLDPTRS